MFFCDQDHKNWYEQIYWPYYPDSSHNSKHFFDIYSLTHLYCYLLLGTIFKNLFGYNIFVIYFLIISGIIFKIYKNRPEQLIKYNRIEINSKGDSSYRGDTIQNSI